MQRKNNRANNRNNRNNNNRGKNQRQSGRGKINIRQCIDKRDSYLNKARDLQNTDRIESEYYSQHADHYQRLINEYNAEQESRRAQEADNDSDDDFEDEAEEPQTAATEDEKPARRRKPASRKSSNDDVSDDISGAIPAAIALEADAPEAKEVSPH